MMHDTDKIRVAVLFGGKSSEHEISLLSAKNVIEQLDPHRFEVIPVAIDKTGQWRIHDSAQKSLSNRELHLLDPDHAWFSPEWIHQASTHAIQKRGVISKNHKPFDVVFPVLHGTNGEDGNLQGLLELADIAYVGCGVLSSAINMDKDVAKRLAQQHGIPVAPYIALKADSFEQNPSFYLEKIQKELPFPLFVKPANTGSSVGIRKVKDKSELSDAIQYAFAYDTKVLVEQGLAIQELEIAVLESLTPGAPPIVSVVGEIEPHHEFYSYDAKYLDENGASLHIPARAPEAVCLRAQALAKEVFIALECSGMARIDLFYDKTRNELYFNESNTIPGFTVISMYPKLMQASSIEYTNLLTHLIDLALRKHQQKTALKRHYNK